MPARTQRLRVYVTQIGFTNWVVAAPSQKAALAAWDVRENLFATGAAKTTDDPRAVALAMKTPGKAVALDLKERRAELGRVIRLDDHRPKPAAAKKPAAKAPPPKPEPRAEVKSKLKSRPKPKPDRSRLTAAEDELWTFQKRAIRERRVLLREREELQAKIDAAEADLAAEEDRLRRRVEQERERYEASRD